MTVSERLYRFSATLSIGFNRARSFVQYFDVYPEILKEVIGPGLLHNKDHPREVRSSPKCFNSPFLTLYLRGDKK